MKLRIPKRAPSILATLLVLALLLAGCSQRLVLGNADQFAILAGGKITSPVTVNVNGGLAALGGSDATVIPLASVTNAVQIQAALSDLMVSKLRLKTLPTTEITAADLTAAPLAPGFYHLAGNVSVPAQSTINVSGNGVYVFNIDGSLTLGSDVTITSLLSGTSIGASNVFWNVGSSAQIGAADVFSGVLLTTGDINVGPNVLSLGKLQTLAGNVAVQGGTFVEASGVINPYLQVSQDVNAVVGQPLVLPVRAGVSTIDEDSVEPIVVSAKNLPAGAVVTPNQGGADVSGPNGSDVLIAGQDDTGDTEGDLSMALNWVPSSPGLYQVLFFAQTNSFPQGTVGGAAATLVEGGIDMAIVTIRVSEPGSTQNSVTGSGSFGQRNSGGTFSVGVQARRAGPNTAQGTLVFANPSLGLSGRSETIKAIVGSVPAPGQKVATVYGTAKVTPYGVVPFIAQYLDGGRTTAIDQLVMTLYVDLDHNGTAEPVTFGGSVPRAVGAITVQ